MIAMCLYYSQAGFKDNVSKVQKLEEKRNQGCVSRTVLCSAIWKTKYLWKIQHEIVVIEFYYRLFSLNYLHAIYYKIDFINKM